jgi:ankyrin repeat protein
MADFSLYHPPVRARFQFSLRLLLVMTAIAAALVAMPLSYYRQRAAAERAMRFIRVVQAGAFEEVDHMLNAEPQLAHGRRYRHAYSAHTPLQWAIGAPKQYNRKVVERILQEHPDLDETSSEGETALHIAVSLNNLFEVQRLIQLGANLNAMDDHGNTPLHWAVHTDPSGNLLQVLLDAGADPNIVPPAESSWEGWEPPLHVAARNSGSQIVTLLLDAGAQIDGRNAKGRTALQVAVAEGRRRGNVADLLVKRGANLTATQKSAAGR